MGFAIAVDEVSSRFRLGPITSPRRGGRGRRKTGHMYAADILRRTKGDDRPRPTDGQSLVTGRPCNKLCRLQNASSRARPID